MDDKIKILIASVLKPADDVRSCYKIGQSLAQTNKYEVNIIGFNSKKKAKHQNIFLFPIFKFKRNSFKRLLAPFSILKIYLQLKPKLILVNTPELLWVMFLIRILFGTKIIYDIQENYGLNIKQNQIYRGIAKSLALLYIRINENLSKHFIDGFILAENIYEKQLKFIHKKPYIKLLNKSTEEIQKGTNPIKFTKSDSLKFIYSGTIGKEYGTIEAIEFCKKLYNINSKITLTIIGYSTNIQYLKLVKEAIRNDVYIQLKTDEKPIPQSEIITEINNSDIAILPYQLNPNISGRFPTKIYDYLALRKPMVIPPHTQWKAYLDQYQAGICTEFNNPDIESFMQELSSTTFYKKHPKDEIQWNTQETLLIEFIKKILSK
ncbi:glycosyltransferase [Marivirga salinae]|uniref:Glycosyltransferase n=1 Tax=Marivirga salinarum TaxID=3059078 RepID=A0AA51NA15_9BACT|nr:glycosyltransferase [Marivirga sp. BDSF4-3]WMN11214.1 glycosyltransferase [Marivirga sp. BDSF4-3]